MKIKKNLFHAVLTVLILTVLYGCSDNPVVNTETEVILYERPGLIDSLTGTCAAYLIRRHFLDTIDFTSYRKFTVEFNASTDGDSSKVELLYVDENNIAQVLVNIEGENINNMYKYELLPPQSMAMELLELRLRLFASVCTGHLYHLSLRDLKIYGYY